MLPKLLVIVGPTASGKSALALRIAKRIGGEIVSADSRLLYAGMDIGTAKPTPAEQREIPHHLIDLLPPTRTLTLAEYKKKAYRAILGIVRRGKLPILIGGTGLYVQALVENLEIPEVPPDPAYRAFMARKGTEWVLERLRTLDPTYAQRIGPNPRYASRALEVIRATGKPFSALQGKGEPIFDAHVIGIDPGKERLQARIRTRVRRMVAAGLLNEARTLRKIYPRADVGSPLWTAIGYRELLPVLEGRLGLRKAVEDIIRSTNAYAKRQMTWWRRMGHVRWHVKPATAARDALSWLKRGKA